MAAGGGNEPNLTPLIDLFSVLIVFLLMTASWLQLESIQVQVEQKPASNQPDNQPVNTKPDEDKEKKVKLSLKLYSTKVIAKEDEIETEFIATSKEPGSIELENRLKEWKSKFNSKNSLIITSDASASYGQLIRLYDFVVNSGWNEIGINPY